ncbi:MAG TPA: response regulator [Xanthomonadaceae bacterium]|nr:response regulator [Xanthomonadaceae bacterium]
MSEYDPLAALTADYRSKLPRRRLALLALWQRLPEDSDARGIAPELRLQVHRLAGSAGAYGFDRLSQAARVVDQSLKVWLASTPDQRTPIDHLVDSTRRAFDDLMQAFDDEGTELLPVAVELHGGFDLIQVEDDIEQAHSLGAALMRLGMRVRHAPDDVSFWDVLAEGRPDAILIDYWIGAETGADLARALRATPGYERLPLLCLTSDTSNDVRVDALAAGCDEVFSKVQSAPQLAASICAWAASVVE